MSSLRHRYVKLKSPVELNSSFATANAHPVTLFFQDGRENMKIQPEDRIILEPNGGKETSCVLVSGGTRRIVGTYAASPKELQNLLGHLDRQLHDPKIGYVFMPPARSDNMRCMFHPPGA